MTQINVAIIGAGQLGSRHLQGLCLIDREINVYVIDPQESSIEIAKKRFAEQAEETGTKIENIHFYQDTNDLPNHLDVVIVATNSNVRRNVIESLLEVKSVRYLILEKFLFQKLGDYQSIEELITRKNVKVWVNCPRRLWNFYQELRNDIRNAEHVNYSVSGSNIGLGCNGIHFLDHLSYLVEDRAVSLSSDLLDDEIINSKRPGYIEFTGTLYGVTTKGHQFSITSYKNHTIPVLIQIHSDKVRCVIRENEGKAYISYADEKWAWKEVDFEVKYQSKLTNLVVQDLLDHGDCALTSYQESSQLHQVILNALLKHMEKIEGKEVTQCQIT